MKTGYIEMKSTPAAGLRILTALLSNLELVTGGTLHWAETRGYRVTQSLLYRLRLSLYKNM